MEFYSVFHLQLKAYLLELLTTRLMKARAGKVSCADLTQLTQITRYSKIATTTNQVTVAYFIHIHFAQFQPRVWPGHPPLFPLSIYFVIFCFFHFSLSFIGFTYFLLLSIPSLSTRIVPLRFQTGGRRKPPNLGLVCFVCVICIP